VLSQERRTINQQKPGAGEMEKKFEEHLNEGSKSEQPTRPVDLKMMELTLICRADRRGAERTEKQRQPARILSRSSCLKTVNLIWWMHYMK
jgi:hypothetical protein